MEEAPKPDGNGNGHDDAPEKAFREAVAQMSEFKAYLQQYVIARTDELRLTIRGAFVWAIMWTLVGLAGSALVITAVVLVAQGLAQAVADLMGGNAWAGNLVVGLLLLATAGLFLRIASSRFLKDLHSQTVTRYQKRLEGQQNRFGRNAEQCSAEYPSKPD